MKIEEVRTPITRHTHDELILLERVRDILDNFDCRDIDYCEDCPYSTDDVDCTIKIARNNTNRIINIIKNFTI